MWNLRYPNKTIWFTTKERIKRIFYKLIGYKSYMINPITGQAIYQKDKQLDKDIKEENNIPSSAYINEYKQIPKSRPDIFKEVEKEIMRKYK